MEMCEMCAHVSFDIIELEIVTEILKLLRSPQHTFWSYVQFTDKVSYCVSSYLKWPDDCFHTFCVVCLAANWIVYHGDGVERDFW